MPWSTRDQKLGFLHSSTQFFFQTWSCAGLSKIELSLYGKYHLYIILNKFCIRAPLHLPCYQKTWDFKSATKREHPRCNLLFQLVRRISEQLSQWTRQNLFRKSSYWTYLQILFLEKPLKLVISILYWWYRALLRSRREDLRSFSKTRQIITTKYWTITPTFALVG